MLTPMIEKLIGRALAQHVQNLNQRPAVLAAREADHDAVAVLDQVEVVYRLGDFSRHLGFKVCRVPHSRLPFRNLAPPGGTQPRVISASVYSGMT